MNGQISHELEVNVPATQAWELYGTLQLSKLVEKKFQMVDKIEIEEGDGGVGTVLNIKFAPGPSSFPVFKEKFTRIDDEKRIKEIDIIEGGFLDLGFNLFRVIFEIIEKGNDSCIIKSSIEYQVKEEAAANASLVNIDALANVAEISKNYLLKSRA